MENIKNYFEWCYCMEPNIDEPVVRLNGEIGCVIWGDQFAKEIDLLNAMGASRIKVIINSPGGSVIEGMTIYESIINSSVPVDTYCGGMCLSIAAVIFEAGQKRYFADYGQLMFHDPYGGNDDESLTRVKDSITVMVSTMTGKTKEEVSSIMSRDTWISSDEVVSLGFADEVIISTKNKRDKMLAMDKVENKFQLANVFMNKFVEEKLTDKKENTMKVEEIKDSVEVEELQEQVDELTDQLEEATEELEEAQEDADVKDLADVNNDDDNDYADKMNKANEEIVNLKNQLASISSELKEFKDLQNKAKIDTMLDGYVKVGKIKAESKEKWFNLANANFDEVNAIINDFPVNRTIPVIGKKKVEEIKKEVSVNLSGAQFITNKLKEAKNKREQKLNFK